MTAAHEPVARERLTAIHRSGTVAAVADGLTDDQRFPRASLAPPRGRTRDRSEDGVRMTELGTGRSTRDDSDVRRFVVQRHRARRLHYDFRLQLEGVLVSWAVPKGPTLDPRVRRAAFRVEDHELEYIDFEGAIGGSRYGAGDVIVWDTGTWAPKDDAAGTSPREALDRGELHLDLSGRKLAGRFVLIRTGIDKSGKQRWLLLHKNDEFAVPGWDPEDHPRSVLSGRTNDEVRAEADRTGPPDP